MSTYSRKQENNQLAIHRHIIVAGQERNQVVKQKRLSARHRIGLHKGEAWLITCNLCNPKVTGFKPLTNPNA